MGKIRLALLSGGDSSEREVSLSSGNQVYNALDREKYEIHRYDPKTDLMDLVRDAHEIDAALLILHGPNGEDGTIQGLLDLLHIPYQGAGVMGSAVAMNKITAKRLYEQAEIPIPAYLYFEKHEHIDIDNCITTLGLPIVVKPANAGSSVGIAIVNNEQELSVAIKRAFDQDSLILMEEYIKGLELTCGVLGNREMESFPVIEIIPGDGYDFFDYKAKYLAGATKEICPARIDDSVRTKVQEYAIAAHKALFLKGYSRTDMILKQGKLYILETNTIPGMTETSLYPQAAKAAGYSFPELLDRLIFLAMDK